MFTQLTSICISGRRCPPAALGYEHLGKHEEAVEMLLEAEDYVDGNNDFYYTLARHLDALGRIDDAIAAYQKSIDILPTAIAYGRICSLKKYTVGDPEFEVRVSLLAWRLATGTSRVLPLRKARAPIAVWASRQLTAPTGGLLWGFGDVDAGDVGEGGGGGGEG
jgi:tetratricopeptide (TPR) repeat protein